MDNIAQSLSESVKRKEYFRDALEWYALRYLNPYSHIVFLALVASALVAAIAMLAYNLDALAPYEEEVSYVTRVPSALGKRASVETMGSPMDDAQAAFLRYMVSVYVEDRENYTPTQIDKQMKRIRGNSSPLAYYDYHKSMDIYNPKSPKRLYAAKKTRTITINSVDFVYNDGLFDHAIVRFKSVIEEKGSILSTDQWEATLDCLVSSVDKVLEGDEPLKFQVTGYHVTLLS